MPISKMNFCSRFLRLSVVPRCRERPQIAMCFLEWLGRLKWRATGLDASLSFFSTSRRCSRNRSPLICLAFLDIKVSIRGNVLCTSVHYKPTDSHSYLLYSSSHPSHVKNSIPYSQFLRLRRLCSDDSDFSSKSEEMCQFFEKRGYPVSVAKAGHHRAQQFDRESSLQTSQKDKNDRIPFTLTFHPHNHAVKSIILSNFKLLQNDPETGRIFSQPPLISFKRDKNVGNFLVRSALKTNEQPGTFKCARSRCKTCLFIVNTSKISGPKRSVKITDRFTCTSANVIYCITCTLCNKLYIGETGRRLGDRFREHLRDVEKNDKDASKPVARHFNLPNHSKKHMAICGLSLHLGTTESRKNLEQKFIFEIGTLNPHGINERFSFNQYIPIFHVAMLPPIA